MRWNSGSQLYERNPYSVHFVFWVETDCVKVERWAPGGVCPLYFPTVLLPPLSLNTTLSCHTRCCSEPANASFFLSFYQTVPCALHHLTSLHPAASQNQGVSAQKFSSQLCSCAVVQLCSCASSTAMDFDRKHL